MGLDDFEKLGNVDENIEKGNSKKNKDFINNVVELQDIKYYLSNMDELIDNLKKSYYAYVNAKVMYEFKKNYYQTTINWNDENNLREIDGLPKLTNQTQKDAAVEVKLKNKYVSMKTFELEYKMYSKIFDFISKNYGFLVDNNFDVVDVENLPEYWKNKLEEFDVNELFDV